MYHEIAHFSDLNSNCYYFDVVTDGSVAGMWHVLVKSACALSMSSA